MDERAEIVVLRLGHRPGRDDRMTTHVGLTARALGADRFVLVGSDTGPLERIDDVTERFGGPFRTECRESYRRFFREWHGPIIHLTMYGLPVQDVVGEIMDAPKNVGVAIVVGAEKVPFEVYERADWNVAVTNQPHSEVASLAVLLDRLLGDEGLESDFRGGTHRIIPQKLGKRVEEVSEESRQ